MYPIDLVCLHEESTVPCDLYRKVEDRDYVFFAKNGMNFSSVVKQTLLGNRDQKLYIEDGDVENYFDFIKEELNQIIRSPRVSPREKASAMKASCHLVMKKTFEDPRAFFIKTAQDVIDTTVTMVTRDDEATRHLVELTAYDHCTYIHSTNVGIFSIALAKIFFGTGGNHDMNRLATGFFLHDLGKCRIPIEILNKPGRLTEEERRIVNRHPDDGHRMLVENGVVTEEARIIVLQHHERDDGTGYPNGLTSRDIHPYARICRLADIYEALTSERPYHKRRTTYEALKIIKAEMTDVDQDLLRCFINLFAAPAG